MKRIRSATINGKRHRVIWRDLSGDDAIGLAYPDEALIEIDTKLDEQLTVEILIHEYLHKALPDHEETKIDQMGAEIATMLTRADLIARDDD